MKQSKEPSSGSGSSIENGAPTQNIQRTDSARSANALDMTRTISTNVVVEGSSQLYVRGKDHTWEKRYVPMPTASPKDPLNLPTWRKALIISSVCFFGAMAFAPEAILAALLPVFVLEYAHVDPKILGSIYGLPQVKGGGPAIGPHSILANFPGPPYWKVTLISTLPILVIGVSNYFTVPLSIAVGRRPVVIGCGLLAWTGAIWAGKSTSLESHLGARSLQAIGAGTVESLIPLIVQDLVFINYRNRCFSAVWAAQGIIIVTLGICSPIIVLQESWRWVYFITAILAAISWLVIIITMPETRFFRTTAELRGEPAEPLPAGFDRPPLNPTRYGKRTWWDEVGFFSQGFAWKRAAQAMLASFTSFLFPNIFWVILINGLFSAVSLAAGQTGAMVLITKPYSWHFRILGLAVLPIVIASFFVVLFAGYGADKISNFVTRKFFNGRREPEVHLINLIIPLIFSIVGCVMFGAGGTYMNTLSWGVFVVGIGFLSFGLLSANVIFSTYSVESYPEWAGPVLVNVACFRNIIGFGFSFKVTDWISELGFIHMFGIYAGVIALLSFGLIPMYFYGKTIRKFCGKYVWSLEKSAGNITAREDPLFDEKGVMVRRRKNEQPVETVEAVQEQSAEKKSDGWAKFRDVIGMRDKWGDKAWH